MTSPMWQKSDELPVFFPQPIFAEPPRPSATINLPILDDTPPEDEIFVLSYDDIVASEEESAAFLFKVAHHLESVYAQNIEAWRAYDFLETAYQAVGEQGILEYLELRRYFDQKIEGVADAARGGR